MNYKSGDQIGITKFDGNIQPMIIESINGNEAVCVSHVNPESKTVLVSLVTKKVIKILH